MGETFSRQGKAVDESQNNSAFVTARNTASSEGKGQNTPNTYIQDTIYGFPSSSFAAAIPPASRRYTREMLLYSRRHSSDSPEKPELSTPPNSRVTPPNVDETVRDPNRYLYTNPLRGREAQSSTESQSSVSCQSTSEEDLNLKPHLARFLLNAYFQPGSPLRHQQVERRIVEILTMRRAPIELHQLLKIYNNRYSDYMDPIEFGFKNMQGFLESFHWIKFYRTIEKVPRALQWAIDRERRRGMVKPLERERFVVDLLHRRRVGHRESLEDLLILLLDQTARSSDGYVYILVLAHEWNARYGTLLSSDEAATICGHSKFEEWVGSISGIGTDLEGGPLNMTAWIEETAVLPARTPKQQQYLPRCLHYRITDSRMLVPYIFWGQGQRDVDYTADWVWM